MLSQITKLTLDTNTYNAQLFSNEIGKLSSLTALDVSGPGIIGDISDFVNKSNITEISLILSSGSTDNFELALQGLDSLETLNTNVTVKGELDLVNSGLSYLKLNTNPNSSVISFSGNTWKSGWYYMNLQNCNMTQDSCNKLLIAANESGIEDETSGVAPPTLLLNNNSSIEAPALNALIDLESKGWNVDADWPIYAEFTVVITADGLTYRDYSILHSGKTIVVDWGDGSTLQEISSNPISHLFVGSGTYNIKYYNPENIKDFDGNTMWAGTNKWYINFETSLKRMTNLEDIYLRSGSSPNNIYSGSLKDFPRSTRRIWFEEFGSSQDNISGDLEDLPKTLYSFEMVDCEGPEYNLENITGDMSSFSGMDELAYIDIRYSNIPSITYEKNLTWGSSLGSLKVQNSETAFTQNSVNLAVRDAKNSNTFNNDLYVTDTGYTVSGEYVQDLIWLLNNSWDVQVDE